MTWGGIDHRRQIMPGRQPWGFQAAFIFPLESLVLRANPPDLAVALPKK
jgi:hypothetical protein